VELGRSNLNVTRLVFGCAPLGGLFSPVTADEAAATLSAAWDAGARAFDTAPHYGVGSAEERLGRFLASKDRSEYVVCTKVGRLLLETDEDVEGADGFYGTPGRLRVRDYSREGVRRSIAESCARMGLDRVDVALIHDPDDHWDAAINEAYPALEELRNEGVVSAIGVGMNQVEMLERFVEHTDIDCVLVAGRYSLLDSSAEDVLLPACRAAGVGVLLAGVYNSGVLADPHNGATFNYAPASASLLARVKAIGKICSRHGVTLPAAAIQYVLLNPAITAVVMGARSAAEARANAQNLLVDAPAELFEELAEAGLLGRQDA
jgi:D-threo-aldose 1-dehydrogenase